MMLHRAPPHMTPEEYRVPDEVIAQLQEVCMDKARKRLEVVSAFEIIKVRSGKPIQKLLQNETCCRIFKQLQCLEPTHFVVVSSSGNCLHKYLKNTFFQARSLGFFIFI